MKKERRPKGYWTRATVQKEMLERRDKGLSIRMMDVYREEHALGQAVYKVYGDWNELYEDIGVEIRMDERKPRGYWTKERIVLMIKERYREGKEINATAVMEEAPGLYEGGRREFGQWGKAIEGAGFKESEISLRRSNGYWTAEKIVEKVKRLSEEGNSLRPKDVVKENGSLYERGVNIYGSWSGVLEASGYKAEDIYQRRAPNGYWTKERVLEYLVERELRGVTNKAQDINNIQGTVYRKAREYFGAWKAVMEAVDTKIKEVG